MEPIPMLDLAAQHQPLRAELEAAFARVLASNRFILGPEVAAFENEAAAAFAVPHAIGMSSGTDALLALLMAAGIGPGDEVVTTPYSFFATVEAVLRLGARPVFADVEPDTLNLDPALAAERLSGRTRAVLVAHLFGRAARTAAIEAVCADRNVAFIEDAAQSLGATASDGLRARPIAASGFGAAISFFPAKNLGGLGDGGMVLTANPDAAARVRLLRNHGADAPHRHPAIGGNFRLDELQAALLRVKLPRLERWQAARVRAAARYREQLAALPIQLPPPDAGCVWNQFVVRMDAERRTGLRAHLDRRAIATAVYYPLPLHLQPALAPLGYRSGDFPNAERAAQEALALPMHPTLTDAQIDRVAGAIADFFR